jgi:alpha-tubulin suppressor-like RCC1 family protein
VRELVGQGAVNSAWLVLHRTSDGVDTQTVIYDPFDAPYDFENLELKAGDVLHLVFVIDEDGDGLRSRQETAFGSDILDPDTDDDGVQDGEEILWGLRPTVAETVPATPDGRRVAASFSTSQNSFMAITRDNMRLVRGSNFHGMAGNGIDDSALPLDGVVLDNSDQWVVLAPGFDGTLAINADGQLFFWGRNHYGIAGQGDTNWDLISFTPLQIGTDSDWVHVWQRRDFVALALKSDNTLWAWGRNEVGQAGVPGGVACPNRVSKGDSFCHTAPVQVPGSWSTVSVGRKHVLAVATDGSLWGWGLNDTAELSRSIGSLTACLQPDGVTLIDCAPAPIPLAASGVWSKVSAGARYSLGIQTDGTLWSWGSNNRGQLGLGTSDPSPIDIPTRIGTALWADASAGYDHAAAIRSDGTLWTWGFGASGRLGNGQLTSTNANAPQQVGTDTNWDRIWATEAAVIARTTIPYRLVGWGRNDSAFISATSDSCEGAVPCVPAPTQIFPLP